MRTKFGSMVLAASLLAACPLQAQTYPSKVVRMVIPFPVGGSSEANARIINPHLSERWKQQVILDTRPGAATAVGTEHVVKSPPDGYTILLTSTQFPQMPALFAKLPFDPLNDLVPITIVSISPQTIVAHPSLPVRNIRELIALAKARPGELNMGNAGNSLPTHLFRMLTHVNIETVPYKGAGPLVTDVMGGHVTLGIGAVSSMQGIVRAGRARMLGVSSPSRAFPQVPVISKDVPGFDADAWFGLFAPKGTPRDIVNRVRSDVAAVLQLPDVQKRLLELGGEPGGMPPEEFAARVRREIEKWKKVAAAANLKPQ
ncbi:MAG TPA: tripartite tricarboxylate transporter substrate binding protein [Burkholderiales bacterium]|nr:tripartite tricarboxylate transporter substrate binding protein [Burkholderiales bacterium]